MKLAPEHIGAYQEFFFILANIRKRQVMEMTAQKQSRSTPNHEYADEPSKSL